MSMFHCLGTGVAQVMFTAANETGSAILLSEKRDLKVGQIKGLRREHVKETARDFTTSERVLGEFLVFACR